MTNLESRETTVPAVGEKWRRIGGKQVVVIHRVWTICGCDSVTMHAYDPRHDGAYEEIALRALPTHGGSWWTVLPEFLKRFEQADTDGR